MTKKHFIALADAIKAHNESAKHGFYGSTIAPFTSSQIDTLADFCGSQNGGFNRARWLAYIAGDCGPNGGRNAPITRKAKASAMVPEEAEVIMSNPRERKRKAEAENVLLYEGTDAQIEAQRVQVETLMFLKNNHAEIPHLQDKLFRAANKLASLCSTTSVPGDGWRDE